MGKFISYFSCYFSKPGDLYKGVSQNHNFQIIKTFQSVPDCIITKEEPIYSGNHDVFSLSTHDNYLIATTPNSFLLISLNKESLKMKDVKRLKLPSDLQNVRKKLNESNHCILASNEFNSHLAIAAIWDINTVLEAVHTLDVMELSIDDIIIFESSNLIISLTRNRIAQWNLRTGELTGVFENPGGAAFDKMELSPDGKYLATSDCSSLLIWNLKARVVLFRENIENIRQLVNLSSYGLLSVSLNVYIDKEEGSKEAVVKKSFNLFSRNLVNGRKMFSLDVPVRFVLDIVITRDQNFIITMGIDKLKGTDAVYVHHTKKGSLAHKITLKYPSFKRPSAIVPYESSYIVIVDSEKGNVLDVRHRKFLKSIYKWTGQTSENGKFGLSSPTSGGLSILDLKTGKRRTIRLFRRSDGKLISNYWLHSDASVITSSISPLRIVIGGIDGSVTVLLIADIESKKYLEEIRSLPSRMVKCIDENGEDSYISQNIPREINRKDPLLRFRAIARVALFMDRVLKKNHIKTTESMNFFISVISFYHKKKAEEGEKL
ncbi:unnamed protein product [Lepeophtheirus salmonis]|uniref:(salmon louse) hypothetical protein n=1 Tax=Lepeophtheirus salmonis TaxID=72036 RepID=A0A7R8H6V7_LEPSM|nr:unnamed protein product [Lepeophtheirus salmonis]CAF2904534.1 unnamed protein product [Lepeophtheirus salmonis]